MADLVKRSRWIFFFAGMLGLVGSALLAWWASQPSWEGIAGWENGPVGLIQGGLEWLRELLVNCRPVFVFLICWPGLTALVYELGLLGWVFPGGLLRSQSRENLLRKWTQERLRKISQVIDRQGVDSALGYNRNCQEEEENQVAGMFHWIEVCEWVLPLLGFLGTVWGLHQAIGPLKNGVSTMMKALGNPHAQQLREEAMVYFGQGFEGLRVAFDTTLLALMWVVVVGVILQRIRKRVFDLLTRVNQQAEEHLRQVATTASTQRILLDIRDALFQPAEGLSQNALPVLRLVHESLRQALGEERNGQWRPYLDLLHKLASLVQQGLFHGMSPEGQPTPLLRSLEQLLSEALFVTQSEGEGRVPLLQLGLLQQDESQQSVPQIAQGTRALLNLRNDLIPRLEAVLKELREKGTEVDLRRIETLLEAIHHEGRKRTYIQWEHLKPGLHELVIRSRQMAGQSAPTPDPLDSVHLQRIDGEELFAGLDVTHLEIEGIALANRASRMAAAGYNQNAGLSFIRDQWIDWLDRICPIRSGIAWTTSAPSEFAPGAALQSLRYDSTAETLFGLTGDGRVIAWSQGGSHSQPLRPGALVLKGTPLLWLPSTSAWPQVLCWVFQEDGSLRLEILSLGEEPPLPFDPQWNQWIGGLAPPEQDFSLLVRNVSDYLCLAGQRRNGEFGIQVAYLKGTPFQSIAEATFQNPICSCDLALSSEGPVAVVGVQNEGIYQWKFLESPPQRLQHLPSGYGNTDWLFLDAAGKLLAVILPNEVRVFSLADPTHLPWRPFSLDGEQVVLAESAADQSSVIIYTNRKAFRILLFEEPQTFIGP